MEKLHSVALIRTRVFVCVHTSPRERDPTDASHQCDRSRMGWALPMRHLHQSWSGGGDSPKSSRRAALLN